MKESDVRLKVVGVISYILYLSDDEVEDSHTLEDYGMDSLGSLDLALELEDVFDIKLPNDVHDSWKTVGDVVKKVVNILSNNSRLAGENN